MELRLLEMDEVRGAFPIWSQAFRGGKRDTGGWDDYRDEGEGQSFVVGVREGKSLESVVIVTDYRVHWGPEVVLPMGGVGGVACLPASRGKGYAGACLRFSLEQMRTRNHVLSTLGPFSWDYYRRFGWEWVGLERKYTVPTRILKAVPETEQVRRGGLADYPAIRDLYRKVALQYRGMFTRNAVLWSNLLDDSREHYTYTYVYEQDGKIEGYLTYRDGHSEKTFLREFLTLTGRAHRALLGLLKRHEMQVEKFEWDAPENDTHWLHGYHWDIETRLEPVIQGRVVDVVGAFQAWKPTPTESGAVVLAVQDECAPWNTGTWRIEFEGGQVTVRPDTAEAQVSLDIQALSQAYYGTPSLAQIRAADRLTVHEEAGFDALQRLLQGPPMWVNDAF